MALTSDAFIERSHLKKQVTFWKLAALCAMVVFLIILIEPKAEIDTVSQEPYIARIPIVGTMYDDEKLYSLLDEVKEDKNVKAVILTMDSPGGVAAAGETIHHKISQIRKVKPVVASMRSICASACYMASLATDYSFAMKSTITGSIGVLFQTAEFSELIDKIGVNPITIKSGKFKGSPSMEKPMTDDERSILQAMIDEFHTMFVTMVSEGRKLDMEVARNLSDGRVYSAMNAHKLGLIDAIGGEDEAKEWLVKNRNIDEKTIIKDLKVKSKMEAFLDKLEQNAGISHLAENTIKPTGFYLIWKPEFTNF